MYAQDSIDLLNQAGIDFKQHEARGIEVQEFGAGLITSGLVLRDEVHWLSFHSGYDFGYLIKVLTCQALPKGEPDFFKLLGTYFPKLYDLKYMMKNCETLNGGLNKLAAELRVKRIGPEHQAGSDSMVTGAAFFAMKTQYFEDEVDDDKFCGVLFGMGQSMQ
jgi:CCR4-NOT transcription complex subunit 7/8